MMCRRMFRKCHHAHETEGKQARMKAERDLARVKAETPYYEGLGNDLRRLRERNHFAENIRATMRET